MLGVDWSTDSFSIGVLRKFLLDVLNQSSENSFDYLLVELGSSGWKYASLILLIRDVLEF